MSLAQVHSSIKAGQMEATVISCLCGDPARLHPDTPCPQGVARTLGIVGYYHRRALYRLMWRSHFLRRFCPTL